MAATTQALRRSVPPPPHRIEQARPRPNLSRATMILWSAAFVLWLVSLARTNVAAIGSLGLLSAFPVTMYLALAILTVSMVRAVQRSERSPVLAAHVLLFLFMMHGTPALLYETLRYSWAWKHLGVVDFFAHHHAIDTHVRNVAIYQSWPGFFTAATSWLVGSGLTSWTGVVQWAPLFFQILNALAVYALLDALETNRRVVWYGVWFFVLGDWIGQDYFSPQAFGFFLYLVALILVVRFVARRPAMPRSLARVVQDNARARKTSVQTSASTHHPETNAALAVFFVITAAMTTSHPLTPFALLAALILLTISRVVTVRRLTLVVATMVFVWLVTGAHAYVAQNISSFTHDIGNLGGSVDQSLNKAANANDAQRLVSSIGRVGIVFLGAMAVFAFVRRVRNGRWDAVPALLSVAPIAILFGSSYGGEAGFRVYLFALPFLSYFAATTCVARPNARRRWEAAAAFTLSAVLALAFMFGYFGKEQWTHFATGEVRASEAVYADAPPRSLVVQGTSDYPIGFRDLATMTYVDLSAEPRASWQSVVAHPVNTLTNWLADPRYQRGYVVITRSQKEQSDALGLLPPGALDGIERALLASPRFHALYHDADAVVFVLNSPTRATLRNVR